ncbi:hypothetical protein [Corynebacterium hadale]|uniref:hypothetical protein n=1 Tax=Corynebacterium hadale TaxID=2026255 RepID=UPI0010563A26|nr:hypothetical protein [Corynebacterium hadale]
MQHRVPVVATAIAVATMSISPISSHAATPSRPSYDEFQRDATVVVNSGSSVKHSYERAVGSSFEDAIAAGSLSAVVRNASRTDIVLTALLGAFAAGSTGYYMVLQGMVPNPLPGIIPSTAK